MCVGCSMFPLHGHAAKNDRPRLNTPILERRHDGYVAGDTALAVSLSAGEVHALHSDVPLREEQRLGALLTTGLHSFSHGFAERRRR